LAPAPPTTTTVNHLTPLIAYGRGISRGYLMSPTTKHPGEVTLVDIAPTILGWFGVAEPRAMTGTAMSVVRTNVADRARALDHLDSASVFREKYAAAVFWTVATLIS